LFYGHLKRDRLELKHAFEFRDIVDGQEKNGTLLEMFESAREEAIRRMDSAIAYYEGKIDKAAAMDVIRGESLDTGREDCPVSRINHTSDVSA
jgi:hypothetical protein